MVDLSVIPLWGVIVVFIAAAAVITFAGVKLAGTAEAIADKTGLGQAIVGAVFLGISTSLSGTVLSFYSASQGHSSLAISNAVGGIAAQTVFLAVADISYRKANLEHAASSLENLLQSALLATLLAVPILAMAGPEVTFFNVHPASVLLVVLYILGLRVVSSSRGQPFWRATQTRQTQNETSQSHPSNKSLKSLLLYFAILALLLGISGIGMAESALEIAGRTGISQTIVGGFLTSVATSLPELITVLAAVHNGALNLAVGDIIGGNSFDVLFLAGSDVFYRAGSIYHQINSDHVVMTTMAMLMNGMLMLGLLRREEHGFAGIGFESVAVLLFYGLLIIMMIF
ncbi:MAG: sodium:calcium antiporter [Pseudohongiellaceae bacterium]